ncbi:hypothetical protein QSJ19_01475 [Gordonia sp. ABSL11-1]|nr:hypothetical protein [Gordonia sp. ABSL11-1]MDL9944273.1 hypothetical protein [Gordonia sp. ABSL11-1]
MQVTLLAEVLAAVQPSSVDDLLDLAALVGDVEAGRLTVQTAVTA